MFRIFSKIRLSLFKEGKLGSYFKYAIGEILLVVIGILIALQINNWNEERQSKTEMKLALQDIHYEFLENKRILQNSITANSNIFSSGKIIMELIGKDDEFIKSKDIDKQLFILLDTVAYTPTQHSLSDILQPGRLQYLENEKLKNLIFQWTQSLQNYNADVRRLHAKVDDALVDYLTKNYALKDIDMHGNLGWQHATTLDVAKTAIFKDIVFENILDDYLFRVLITINDLEQLQLIIDAIIKETVISE